MKPPATMQSGNNGVMSVTYIGIMTENRPLNYMMMEHINLMHIQICWQV